MTMNEQEQIEMQEDKELTASAARSGIQAAQRFQERRVQNEQFLNELRKADVDSDVFDWAEEEFPTWFSGAHAVTNRGDDWDFQADLIMQSKRERAYAERNPGRLLRDRPMLLAIAQGRTDPGQPQPLEAMSTEERRVTYGAAEVAADLMSLSRNKAGLKAVSEATTETRVSRDRQKDETASKIGRIFE